MTKTASAEAIVEYDPESVNMEDLNAFDSDLEVPYIDEPLADDNWITEYRTEV